MSLHLLAPGTETGSRRSRSGEHPQMQATTSAEARRELERAVFEALGEVVP